MEKKEMLPVLKQIRENSKKRKFKQKLDLIFNLKDIDIKKTEEQIDFFITLPHSCGKKMKVCALVGPELRDEAQKECDSIVIVDDFDKYQRDKKIVRKLADDNDVFIAQANIMPRVAQAFGRVLGPKKKMPNPKAGCIVPPKAQLGPIVAKLQKQVRIAAKTSLTVQILIGNEDMTDDQLAENIITLFNQVVHHLPKEKNNIKDMLLKMTMGAPVSIKI
ncbi:hypothetical protein COV93_01280 [Candidatus Woesearchaeota archaeon CG11_big_fil_rev_8_21_14_0_20_43_8]|nr:MAG: hypothetical protein COV93_01280 [Candidatus Woesearchaeota archaeon CG11_big_fil_rev_8_21_14_0_20_43_8]PIO04849.1 MAG: hypothetical protein COT47_07270 [Candidatus Woesearchaeota archaeon CG08_land_8_20_14_0_20_43_7]